MTASGYAESWELELLPQARAVAFTFVPVGVASGFFLRHFYGTPLWGAIVGGFFTGVLAGLFALIGTVLWLERKGVLPMR